MIVTVWVCLGGCCDNNLQSKGDVHLNIPSTFVKHLERLFTPKNQDNSEKGHLVVSQTFDLNFLPFQGHKNHFPTGHFLCEICRSFQIRTQK